MNTAEPDENDDHDSRDVTTGALSDHGPLIMASANPTVISMPGIDGVTLEHNGCHFLRPELLLDFISVTEQRMTSVTPLAVLYTVMGVRQILTLRGIPVVVNGRTVYPVSSLSLPSLRAHLIINEQNQKLRFQGNFISLPDTEHTSDTVLLGLALTFSVGII